MIHSSYQPLSHIPILHSPIDEVDERLIIPSLSGTIKVFECLAPYKGCPGIIKKNMINHLHNATTLIIKREEW